MRTLTRARYVPALFFYLVPLMMLISLSGCFKSDVAIQVNANGSGAVSLAVGMTQQAQALASDQGSNPLQKLEATLSNQIGAALTGIEVKKWNDGNYDWISAAKKFNSIEEINQILGSGTLFTRFSLTRNRGFLQDEFILAAEIPPLGGAIPPEYLLLADPSAYVQMTFSADMPGTILETNGMADANDPNRVSWNVPIDQPLTVGVRSQSWNWVNIAGMIAAGLILLAALIFALVYFFIGRKNK